MEPENIVYRCPECHDVDSFRISITTFATVRGDKTVDEMDFSQVTWDLNSPMSCTTCDYGEGRTVANFIMANQVV